MDKIVKELGFVGWQYYASTTWQKFVIKKNDGSIQILKEGETFFTGKYFSIVDNVYEINLTPIEVDAFIGNSVSSKDGIALRGNIKATLIIQDTEEKIKRLLIGEKQEIETITNSIVHYASKFLMTIDSSNINKTSPLLFEHLFSLKDEITNFQDSCFSIKSLKVASLEFADSELNKLFTKSVLDKKKEEKNNELTQVKQQIIGNEQKYKQDEILGQLEIDKIKAEHQIDLDKKKVLADLEIEEKRLNIEKLKREAEIENKKQEAELMKSEEGKFALHPDKNFKLKEKEMEVRAAEESGKQKLLTGLLNQSFNSTQAYQQGQLNAMKAVAANSLNIKLTDANEVLPNLPAIQNSLDKPADENSADKKTEDNKDE